MSGIHKFLTRRERNSKVGKQNKDEASNILSRPHFNGFFASDRAPEPDQEEQKKLKILERRIAQLGFTGLKEEHFIYALQAAKGDAEKAFDLLLLLEDSIEGIIRSYTPSTKLLGAVNRQGVTCYLDALLFAMFARLDSFEAILYKSFNDEPRRKLSILLRLWVNMLRSGKLITTDLTKHLQDALAECGWEDAAQLRQQDTSEAFTFITEKLELPLLTLKMDIYHTGKEDMSSDHKFVNERLLEVAIPEPFDGKTVTLEDCLESYFNNRIEVKRYLERRNTVGSTKSHDSLTKGFSSHVETVEVIPSPTASPTQLNLLRSDDATSSTPQTGTSGLSTPQSAHVRRSSIVQERFVFDSDDKANADDCLSPTTAQSRRGSYRKEVMMPAWQFFSLIPWYTDNTPTSDAQVAAHFSSKRPMLGMCLKRYSVLPNGKAIRLSTYVDIPTEIGLPHFIQDDNMDEEGPIYGNFKLSLQALVCHRGNSVDSGHYIAIVRGTSAGAHPANGQASEIAYDTPQYWMRFDDLAEERVTLVDIEQALKTESPYLLFYQILPINEDAAEANPATKPACSDSSEDGREIDTAGIMRKLHTLSTSSTDPEHAHGCGSGRPSFEITTPEDTVSGMVDHIGRKPSVAFSSTAGSTNNLQVHTISSTSPRIFPKDSEGKASAPNSRRGSRSTWSAPGSRAGSQTGESRISATFSRFTGRRSKDKSTSDGSAEDDVDDFAMESEMGSQSGDVSIRMSRERKEKSPRRTKDRERSKGKSKDRSRERFGRKLDRECVVM